MAVSIAGREPLIGGGGALGVFSNLFAHINKLLVAHCALHLVNDRVNALKIVNMIRASICQRFNMVNAKIIWR